MLNIDEKDIEELFRNKLLRYFGVNLSEASAEQIYKAISLNIKDILNNKRAEYNAAVKRNSAKKVYYLCMEFLMGRQLKNNLMNLGLYDVYEKLLRRTKYTLSDIERCENDPGLGNGGLGRLAACFMDALTTSDYPVTGFSICYEYGFFKQKLVDGEQIEMPDLWLSSGEIWLTPRSDRAFSVRFGGKIKEKWNENGKCEIIHEDYEEVQALPYDLMISGANCDAVNNLRLWKAENSRNFNMKLFSQGQYIKALEEKTNAEIISKVLYPSDNHSEGKLLRLSQQYFLVSASLQSIIADHLQRFGSLESFSEKAAIHINDTHPALAIPELMRILVDTYSYSWEKAWDTVKNVFSYTNHTVMPEALECWNEDMFKFRLPRIHMIITEINRRFCEELWDRYPGDWNRISKMSVISSNQVKMANLCVASCHTVNGVSELHSDILKKNVFHDFYTHTPEKFTNVTNGIAHRRWLCYSNPLLSDLLCECIGEEYKFNAEKISEFKKYTEDSCVLERLESIKRINKDRFAMYALSQKGIVVNPETMFDVQIKRMHEYKRQLLNVLRIFSDYILLKNGVHTKYVPRTFIFGAKAANGYYMAKRIIKLIYELAREINRNENIRDKINVVFVEDYNVTVAEMLIPAAELSEQISLAGKEASGTGNMKLMANGALTVGTLDGANVEICEAVGEENCYIFGLNAIEADELWKRGYTSAKYLEINPVLKEITEYLKKGINGNDFGDIADYLVYSSGVPDPYMCLADFESYIRVQERISSDYLDRNGWNRKSIINISESGRFSADRSVTEYAEKIWHLEKVKLL